MTQRRKRQPAAFDPKATPEQRQQAVLSMLKGLAADKHPILIGPFRSELGFEVSYWLPFLAWIAKQIPDFDKRASVVSRGGVAPLYGAVASQGYDLYALRSVTDVRRENLFDQQQNNLQKQILPTEWDEAVMTDAAKALGIKPPFHVLHPAWMYWALAPYWDETRGMQYLASMTDYAPLRRPVVDGLTLPDRYVAVKFYGRATLPYPHPVVAQAVPHIVATIAAQVPVVILSSPDDVDDHADIPLSGENISHLPKLGPELSIGVQAAVISKSIAFVGTYGGMQQLALRLGIPSVGFYLEFGGTAHAHLALSSLVSKMSKPVVPFLVGSLDDARLWQQCLTVPDKPVEVAA